MVLVDLASALHEPEDHNIITICIFRFDIRLMQTGRMKGQAFVGLPGEDEAKRAIKETNGYVLYSKPLVVVSLLNVAVSTLIYRCHCIIAQ